MKVILRSRCAARCRQSRRRCGAFAFTHAGPLVRETRRDQGPGQPGLLTLSATDAETSLHIALRPSTSRSPDRSPCPPTNSARSSPPRTARPRSPSKPTAAPPNSATSRVRTPTSASSGSPRPISRPCPTSPRPSPGPLAPSPPRASFSQQAGTLLDLVSKTIFATARETSRYAINGVMLSREGKKLEMVATDGRRLAALQKQYHRATKDSAGGAVTCIVPTRR